MPKHFLILSFVCFIHFAYSQNVKTLKPELSGINEYTKKDQVFWQKALDLYAKINSGDLSYDDLPLNDQQMIDSLEMGHGPLTETTGCSWYCGGGPYKVSSSSYLKQQGKINYLPENLHDFDLFTAWVPDTKGVKINFHFKPLSPRINEIIIYNGYIKNIDLWKANARVKKLKLYVNGSPYAILELEDVTDAQSFKTDLLQSTDKNKDLILTFEIIEVYKGTKYKDVALSEINFNGIDVH